MNGPVGDDHSTARDREYADGASTSGGQSGGSAQSDDSDQFDVLLQLHSRFADLQKREHDLSQRLQRTERERNDLLERLESLEGQASLSKQNDEIRDQLAQRESEIEQREAEIEQRQQSYQQRLATIEQREETMDRQQSELHQQKQQLAESHVHLIEAEDEIQQARKDAARQHEVEADRSSLRSQIEREIEIERTALLQLQSTLEDEKLQHEAELAVKKREYDEALASMDVRLDEEREQIRLALLPVIESEIRAEFGAVDDARLLMERDQETNFEELRRQTTELEEQQQEFQQRIAIEREQLEKDFERQRYELQDEKALFQKRYRFQFDHLQQSRTELEENVRVHRREEQILRVNTRHFETQLQRRMIQVEHYLEVIRKREESVDRQSRLSRQTLRDQLREVELDRERLEVQRQRWEEERSNQHADLERQERLLTSHAENLEERRIRLEELRLELEETHQTTLETRMAVEEGFAQLAQINGTDQTRSRIDAARAAITDHYSHIREGIARQRAEIESSQRQVQVQHEEFRSERDDLTQWMGERDERQRGQQSELDQQVASIDKWESKWREARDAWKHERMEAEQIIRDLLRQLTALQVPGLDEKDVHLPLMDQGAIAGSVVDRQSEDDDREDDDREDDDREDDDRKDDSDLEDELYSEHQEAPDQEDVSDHAAIVNGEDEAFDVHNQADRVSDELIEADSVGADSIEDEQVEEQPSEDELLEAETADEQFSTEELAAEEVQSSFATEYEDRVELSNDNASEDDPGWNDVEHRDADLNGVDQDDQLDDSVYENTVAEAEDDESPGDEDEDEQAEFTPFIEAAADDDPDFATDESRYLDEPPDAVGPPPEDSDVDLHEDDRPEQQIAQVDVDSVSGDESYGPLDRFELPDDETKAA